MDNKLSDNLNLLMAKARLNSSELARLTGLPATTIKRIRNNEQSNPTISTLAPIANHFSISLNELLNGHNLAAHVGGSSSIPLLQWSEISHLDTLAFATHQTRVATELTLSEGSFALKVETKDLEPFPVGALLLVDRTRPPEPSDYVIVSKANSGIAAIKKLIIETDQAYLMSLVPGVNIVPYTNDYHVLGVIVQFKMNLK